jgi:hypothetical protein
VSVGVVGAGGAFLIGRVGWKPLQSAGLVYTVLSIGWVVLWSGIFLSALVDWLLIVPKISGISCPAPCERAGQQRWAGVTALWCFHRGFARLVVPTALIGCPAAIGAVTTSAAGRAISFSIAGLLSVALAEFELQGKAALNYGLNPRRQVGDIVWLVYETADSVRHRPAYLLDVSAEGAKFKYVDETGAYTGKAFFEKHDDDGKPVSLETLNERPRVHDAESPCGNGCAGINWYCWRNPLAHSQSASGGDESA